MAKSKNQKDWFIAERVRALATMYLTRRKDLRLNFEDRAAETGIDVLVDILHDDTEKLGRRMFGVQLKGTNMPVTIDEANRLLNPSLHQASNSLELPYPVCLFYFTMQDNAGYYTWLAEPIIKENTAKLKRRAEAHCEKLDRAALDSIVERVDWWYDVLYTTLIA